MKAVFVLILAIGAASAFSAGHPLVKFPEMEFNLPPFGADDRITGGSAIAITVAPYQIGLYIADTYWCGGALISLTTGLTAAHCVDGFKASQLKIYLGNAKRATGTPLAATKLVIHSGWSSSTLANDIALFKFNSVTQSSSIAPVSLPSSASYSIADGTSVFATGWGRTSDNSGVSSTLQGVTVKVISNADCKKVFSIIKDSNICVATTNGKSTCNGDSGGPLVQESNKVLVGLTSFGSSAGCTSGAPAAFTRVAYYLSWIEANK